MISLCGFLLPGHGQIANPRAWAEYEETAGIILNQPFSWKRISPEKPQWIHDKAIQKDSMYVKLIEDALEQNIEVYYLLSTLGTTDDFNPLVLDSMVQRYGIDTSHANFHIIEVNRNEIMPGQWVRDHGPMNVFENGAETLYNVLFKDDIAGAGKIVSEYLGIPTIEIQDDASAEFSCDGGNYMVDGFQCAIIDAGMEEAPAQLSLYKELFGLTNIVEVPHYLGHIDYYMKLINPETLLVSEQLTDNYTTGYENFSFEEDTLHLMKAIRKIQKEAVSRNGRPFKIVRIPNAPSLNSTETNTTYMTHDASYVNSLIVNRSVFVPQFDNPETDTTALKIYSREMPGYKIIPVNSSEYALGGGAVHCITNSIASKEPVWIDHAWYPDTVNQADDMVFRAKVKTSSGVKRVDLMWATDPGSAFSRTPMDLNDGNLYLATIPAQPNGTHVYYYIESEANSGKIAKNPMVAPDWTYNFLLHTNGVTPTSTCPDPAALEIKVFPNPASSFVNFDLQSNMVEIVVYDIWGRKRCQKLQSGPLRINIPDFAPGVYIYVIKDLESGSFGSGQFVKH